MSADINTYWEGQGVKVSASFSADGVAFDPDVVKVTVTTPAGVSTTYVYGTDEELFKTATGEYDLIIDANEVGVWYYRWWSTGEGQASEQFLFEVRDVIGG